LTDRNEDRRSASRGRAPPSRTFANALVNVAWRNGPVESLHARESRGYPLTERRVMLVTPSGWTLIETWRVVRLHGSSGAP
jgi:hypothetical protein